jgi:hypothetical protein
VDLLSQDVPLFDVRPKPLRNAFKLRPHPGHLARQLHQPGLGLENTVENPLRCVPYMPNGDSPPLIGQKAGLGRSRGQQRRFSGFSHGAQEKALLLLAVIPKDPFA